MAKRTTKKKSDELTLEKYDPNAEVDASDDNSTSEEVAPVALSNVPLDLYDHVPTAEDIRIPRIRLAQGMTPEVVNGDVKAGQWIVPQEGAIDLVPVVIMGMRKTRQYRAVDEDNDDFGEILCESEDGIVGHGDPGGICKECPLAQWERRETGNDLPPLCDLRYHYLVIGGETKQAAEIIMRGSSIRAAQQVNSLYRQAGRGRTAITFGSEFNRGKRGSWYTPKIEKFTRLKEEIVPGEESDPTVDAE